MKFNMSKFKKISSDKKSTTFQHEDGHKLVVAHSGIHPSMRKAFEKLPIHVSGEMRDKEPQKMAKAYADGSDGVIEGVTLPEDNSSSMPNAVPEDSPEAIQQDAAAMPVHTDPPDVAKAKQLYNQKMLGNFDPQAPNTMPNLTFGPNGEAPEKFNPDLFKVAQKEASAGKDNNFRAQQMAHDQAVSDNQARVAAGLPAQPVPSIPQTPQQLSTNPQGAGPAYMGNTGKQASPSQPSQVDDYQSIMGQGYGLQSQAIDEAMKAKQDMSQRQAAVYSQQAANAKATLDQMQTVQQEAAKHQAAFQEALQKGVVDPNHLMENMTAGKKVTTAIGLLLSGIGSGLSKQPNMAMQYLNDQINRDVNAQMHNQATRENLLSNNNQFFKSQMDAQAMTRVQINDMYAHLLDKAAAAAGSPMAKAAADQAKGDLMQKNAFIISNMGKPPGGAGQGQSMEEYLNTLRVVAPEKAKEIEGRYIPGIGIASIPITNEVRSTITERKLLGDNINQLIAFQQKHGGTLEGMVDPQTRAQGEALAKQVQDQYRRANQQGVFKPAEAQFVNGVIADSPSSLFSKYTKLPAYRAAAGINQGNLNALYNSVGIKPQAGGGQPTSGNYVARTFRPSK